MAPAFAVVKARPNVSTRTVAHLARTVQKACTNAICHPSPWHITTAKAQRDTLPPTALRANHSRVPAPALPQIPLGSPLWAQQVPVEEVVAAVTCQSPRSEFPLFLHSQQIPGIASRIFSLSYAACSLHMCHFAC